MPDLARILSRLGAALWGGAWKGEAASALGLRDRQRVQQMTAGQRPVAPGLVADLAELARERIAELEIAIAEAEAAVGVYHGLMRQELALIGWLTSHEEMVDGPDWLASYDSPARALHHLVTRDLADAGGRVQLRSEHARSRLLRVLTGLTDEQASEVAKAAREVDDLTGATIPED